MTSSRTRPSTTRSRRDARAAAERGRIVGGRQRLDRRPAAVDVDDGGAVDQGHVRAGRPLERAPIGVAATRPREGGAVRVRRVGGRQELHDPTAVARQLARLVAHRPQPIDRARERELCGAQPVDEVAAPDPAGLLHGAQDRVDGREPAVDRLARDRLAGHDAVPFEEGEGQRMGALGAGDGGRLVGQVVRRVADQRPSTRGLRRPEGGQPAGSRTMVLRRPLPAQRPQRGEGVVGHLAGPDEVPEGVEHLAVGSPARGGEQLPVEARRRAGGGARGSARGSRRRALDAVRRPRRAQQLAARPVQDDPSVVSARGSRARPRRPRPSRRARRAAAAGTRGRGPGARRARGRRPGSAGRPAGRRPRPAARGRRTRGRGCRRRSRGGGRRRRRDALPGRQEPRQRDRVDGLDLAAAAWPATADAAAAAPRGRSTRARRRRAGTRR